MAQRYRNSVAPVMPETGGFDTGYGDFASALDRAARTVQNHALFIGGRVREQQGLEEGAAAGASGKPQPKKGFAATTPYGAAYNSAAEAEYIANVQADIVTKSAEFEQKYEGDPVGYAENFGNLYRGIVGAAPAEYKHTIDRLAALHYKAGVLKLTDQRNARQDNEALASVLDSQDTAIQSIVNVATHVPGKEGDAWFNYGIAEYDARVDALVSGKTSSGRQIIDATDAVKLKKGFRAALDKQMVLARTGGVADDITNQFTSGGSTRGFNALAKMRAREDLTPEDKDLIAATVGQRYNDLRMERSGLYSAESAALARDSASGKYGPDMERRAAALHEKLAISQNEWEGYVASFARNEETAAGKAADAGFVNQMIDLGLGIDPSNPQQRKAVDTVFDDQVASGAVVMGSKRFTELALNSVRDLNYLPSTANSWATAMLLGGSPAQKVQGALFYQQVQFVNPAARPYSEDPKMSALIDRLARDNAAGVDPETSYAQAEQSIYKMTDAQRKAYDDAYSANKNQNMKGNPQALVDALKASEKYGTHWYSDSPPPITLADQAEYEQSVREFFPMTGGHIDQARKLAAERYMRTHGVETVNGEAEVMRYAPSLMFPQVPTKAIRKDIDRTARAELTNAAPREKLSQPEESAYRKWLGDIGMTREAGYNVDKNFTGTDYDLRGFYKKYGAVDVKKGQHLTDEFKLPNHPTFSNESKFATGGAAQFAGRWDGEKFIPPETRVDLVPTFETDLTRGLRWGLVRVTGDEKTTVYDNEGHPLRYEIPVQPADMERYQQEADAEAMKQGQTSRERRQAFLNWWIK